MLVCAEVALRVTGIASHQILHAAPPLQVFWQYDKDLGWSYTPNSSGFYSNGYFNAFVTIDENGNRRNAKTGTYVKGYQNIFLIGDSTAASFEVNDSETVPALLEKALRDQGARYNVINLGVRAYSTDQEVRKAIQFAALYKPTDIIYLFVDNDIGGNNAIGVGKNSGKGAYVRKSTGDSFMPQNYPVQRPPPTYAGAEVFSRDCNPVLYTYQLPNKTASTGKRINRWLRSHVLLYGAARFIVRTMTGKPDNYNMRGFESRFDPYEEVIVKGRSWDKDFGFAYMDGGSIRKRCHEYFDSQMRFLLHTLRDRIPCLQRLHLVQFPDVSTIELLRQGADSQNVDLFEAMRKETLIDSYINLPQQIISEDLDVNELRCQGDWHFCKEGNQWIASHILQSVTFD